MNVPVLAGLRPLTLDDVDLLHTACTDPLTQRFTTIPRPYTREMAIDFIGLDHLAWAMVDDNDKFCGVIEFRPHGSLAGDIGYHCAPWARGGGMTTQALRTVTAWAHAEGYVRVELRAAVDNLASRRVAEKAGFELEGIARAAQYLNDKIDDLAVYSHVELPPHSELNQTL
ncbi:MAG: GNAT family N-acetyltransferase [Corynebacterium flavescens]|nr:GNAT family N-acetyltransferase [Corynebacterium flavescens]